MTCRVIQKTGDSFRERPFILKRPGAFICERLFTVAGNTDRQDGVSVALGAAISRLQYLARNYGNALKPKLECYH